MAAPGAGEAAQAGDPVATPNRAARFLIIGGALLMLGVLAVMLPDASTMATGTVFGSAVAVGGVVVVYQALRDGKWRGFSWQLLFGSVEIVGGILIVLKPLKGAAAITLLVVIVLMVQAVTQMGLALRIRPAPGWWWLALASLTSAAIAMALALRFPFDLVDTPGEVAGIAMSVTGLAFLIMGAGWFGMKRAAVR